MSGDFSRIERPVTGDLGLWLQQGRVALDADWNANVAIAERSRRDIVRDLVGPGAVPDQPAHGNFALRIYEGLCVTPDDGWVLQPPSRGEPTATLTITFDVVVDDLAGSLLKVAGLLGRTEQQIAFDSAGRLVIDWTDTNGATQRWSSSTCTQIGERWSAHLVLRGGSAPTAQIWGKHDPGFTDDLVKQRGEIGEHPVLWLGRTSPPGEPADGITGCVLGMTLVLEAADVQPVTWDVGAEWSTLVRREGDTPPVIQARLLAAAGHAYVDGRSCTLPITVDVAQQHFLPHVELPTLTGTYRATLTARSVVETAMHDPKLREPALGGPDTVVRLRVVPQIRLEPVEPTSAPHKVPLLTPSVRDQWQAGELRNVLYLIQLTVDAQGHTRLRWSRTHGSTSWSVVDVIPPTKSQTAASQTVATLRPDPEQLRLRVGDMVELLDRATWLDRGWAPCHEVLAVSADGVTITLKGDVTTTGPSLLRRWNQDRELQTSGGHSIELGLQVEIAGADAAVGGERWSVATREGHGLYFWPTAGGRALPLPPHPRDPSMELADVVVVDGVPIEVIDRRVTFQPLTSAVDPGDAPPLGQTIHGDLIVEGKLKARELVGALPPRVIGTQMLQDGAVTLAKLAPGAQPVAPPDPQPTPQGILWIDGWSWDKAPPWPDEVAPTDPRATTFNGRVVVAFADGTVVSLAPGAESWVVQSSWDLGSRKGYSLVGMQDGVHVIGGEGASAREHLVLSDESPMLRTLGSLPQDVAHAAAVVVRISVQGERSLHQAVHILGGGEKRASRSHLIYCPAWAASGSAWRTLKALPVPVSGACATAVEDRVHLVGGTSPWWARLFWDKRAHRVYNPISDRWTRLARLPETWPKPSLVAIGERIVGVGSSEEHGALRTLVYGPADAWTGARSLGEPRPDAQLVRWARDRLMVVSSPSTGATSFVLPPLQALVVAGLPDPTAAVPPPTAVPKPTLPAGTPPPIPQVSLGARALAALRHQPVTLGLTVALAAALVLLWSQSGHPGCGSPDKAGSTDQPTDDTDTPEDTPGGTSGGTPGGHSSHTLPPSCHDGVQDDARLKQPLTPLPSGYETSARGVDVSFYVPKPPWRSLREAGVDFVYVKASQGDRLAESFGDAWIGSRQCDLLRGAYHYWQYESRGTPISGATQAKVFAGALAGDNGELWPIVDLERTDNSTATDCDANLQSLDDLLRGLHKEGVKDVGLYTTPGTYNKLFCCGSKAKSCCDPVKGRRLWVPAEPGPPVLNQCFHQRDLSVWQYNLPKDGTKLWDDNVYVGTAKQLRRRAPGETHKKRREQRRTEP